MEVWEDLSTVNLTIYHREPVSRKAEISVCPVPGHDALSEQQDDVGIPRIRTTARSIHSLPVSARLIAACIVVTMTHGHSWISLSHLPAYRRNQNGIMTQCSLQCTSTRHLFSPLDPEGCLRKRTNGDV